MSLLTTFNLSFHNFFLVHCDIGHNGFIAGFTFMPQHDSKVLCVHSEINSSASLDFKGTPSICTALTREGGFFEHSEKNILVLVRSLT